MPSARGPPPALFIGCATGSLAGSGRPDAVGFHILPRVRLLPALTRSASWRRRWGCTEDRYRAAPLLRAVALDVSLSDLLPTKRTSV